MRRLVVLVLASVLMLSAPIGAVGSATVTSTTVRDLGTRYVRYTIQWTSSAGGAVSGNPFSVNAGRLVSIRFSPGATTPSDQYDVTLAETGGVADLTIGTGANQSNTTSAIFTWDPPIYQDGSRTLDVVISNAGNAKTGTVVILVQVL